MIGNYSHEKSNMREVLSEKSIVYSYERVNRLYTEFYMEDLRRLLTNHKYIRYGWYGIDDFGIAEEKENRSFKDSKSDSYLIGLKNDRDLARDIMDNGTFWPLTVTHTKNHQNQVFKGKHRVISARLLQDDGQWDGRKMFAIELTEPVEKHPKEFYSSTKVLDGNNMYYIPLILLYPDNLDNRREIEEDVIAHGGKIINEDIAEIPIHDYHSVLKATTHFAILISELNHIVKCTTGECLKPSPFINDQNAFEAWIKGEEYDVR